MISMRDMLIDILKNRKIYQVAFKELDFEYQGHVDAKYRGGLVDLFSTSADET